MISYSQYLTSAEVYTPNHHGDCQFGTELTDFPFPVMGAVGGQVHITSNYSQETGEERGASVYHQVTKCDSVNPKVNGMGLVCGGAMEAYDSCFNVPGDIGAKDCKSNLERTATKGNTVWATGIKSKACYR